MSLLADSTSNADFKHALSPALSDTESTASLQAFSEGSDDSDDDEQASNSQRTDAFARLKSLLQQRDLQLLADQLGSGFTRIKPPQVS